MGRVFRGLLAIALLAAAIHACDADGYVSGKDMSGGMSKPMTVRVVPRVAFIGRDLC